MTTRAMPLILNSEGQHLELRNSAEAVVTPSTQLKSGEDARAAAKRAVEEFFGFSAPEDAIREGFQARVGNEVVAVFPVDANKMEMDLLRPAEEIASWAWRDVPKSMGNVVALGFPRNLGERRNSGDEAMAQFSVMQEAVAAKVAGLKNYPPHELAARTEEVAQELEDLRLLAADLGVQPDTERLNGADGHTCESDTCASRRVPAAFKATFAGGKAGYYCAGHEKALERKKSDGSVTGIQRLNASDASKGYKTARALIKNADGTILAARQKDGRSLLPGGHLENGETPEGAVARELQEELGLDIKDALTGGAYDFHGEDGSKHRVFVVDGGKLDMANLTPGDDVEDAEFVNSPFTDSHGQVHPSPEHENAYEMAKCATCGHGDGSHDGLHGKCFDGFDAKNPGRCPCLKFVRSHQNDAGGDVAELERHVEGMAHELGELEKENGGHNPDTCEDVQCPKCAEIDPHGTEHGIGPKRNAAGEKEWWCLDCGEAVSAADREPGGAHEQHRTQLVEKKNGGEVREKVPGNNLEAGAHNHQYPDRLNGAFPVLLCDGNETIATQETADVWRCEHCGDALAGPPKPEQIVA